MSFGPAFIDVAPGPAFTQVELPFNRFESSAALFTND
jgi:hypothetical protein